MPSGSFRLRIYILRIAFFDYEIADKRFQGFFALYVTIFGFLFFDKPQGLAIDLFLHF